MMPLHQAGPVCGDGFFQPHVERVADECVPDGNFIRPGDGLHEICKIVKIEVR